MSEEEAGLTVEGDGAEGETKEDGNVKVSILQQLHSFRYHKASTAATSLKVKVRVPVSLPVNQSQQVDESKRKDSESFQLPGLALNGPTCVPEDTETLIVRGQTEEVEELELMDKHETKKDRETNTGSRANVIRPINRDTVHQICSGQVIVTLCTAVKELVENSLDAGATKIDIRLVEFGSKLIEVSDNAGGIDENNFEGLALKHHTSKIAEFEDLGTLSTFGFRGEALSSLCALANLTVITRHKESEQKSGYKIEYNYRGSIVSKVRCARDFGTSVILKDLFHTLPVRHKEFAKNLKKEYHRMVSVLYGYCLVVDGVRITCTNQVGATAPLKVLAVPAYDTIRERIVALFGSKQLSSLLKIEQPSSVPEEILTEFGLNESTFDKKYEIEGYISKPNHGRSSNDRQFYFINSRPCDPAKISRIVNEVYHTFSRQQNPFVCLRITTNKENVDVNVTPDKRTLYVQNEKILLATIKAALVPLLTTAASSFNPVNSLSQPTISFADNSQSQEEGKRLSSSFCLSNSFEIQSSPSGFDAQYSTSRRSISESVVSKSKNFIRSFSRGSSNFEKSSSSSSQTFSYSTSFKRNRDYDYPKYESSKQPKLSGFLQRFEVGGGKSINTKRAGDSETMEVEEGDDDESYANAENDDNEMYRKRSGSNVLAPSDDEEEEVVYDDEIGIESQTQEFLAQRKVVSVSVDWNNILYQPQNVDATSNEASPTSYSRKFKAKIAPEDNGVAEDELKKQLTKDMFRKMQIIGQFNLGFIVVKNGPDLFIVDQHASDEKYNYEDQEKTTILSGQILYRPLELELPAVSENIIIDNIEIFQKNGFDFIITPEDEPRKRVKMTKIPFSKNIEFGKSDVDELIFMLEDADSGKSFYRPTKIRQMFASRACRKSVMIGTALHQKEMRQIVDHMGEMDQPWNCPHGRPTIRHLINLNLFPDLDLTKFNH